MDISSLRREYMSHGLRRTELASDPIEQFTRWFQQAQAAELLDPNAMAVATCSSDGQPSLRNVLLKAYDARGFVFYTNLESQKAKQLRENPRAALLFTWLPLNRQIKIEGSTERMSASESLKYFLSRPKESQWAAWASQQSQKISSRQILESQFMEMKQKFSQGEVPLPSFWGGYRVIPDKIEFWQGRENRLHDRFVYRRKDTDNWIIDRLSP